MTFVSIRIWFWWNFSTWQADNHRQMFRLSDSKMNLEFPSGQPLVLSPDVNCQSRHNFWNSLFKYTIWAGGCFTNVSRALQDILSKVVYCRNRTSYENFKLTLCTCAQSHALGTRTKFQLEILNANVIFGIVYFRKIILESSRKVSETTPRSQLYLGFGHFGWPPSFFGQ